MAARGSLADPLSDPDIEAKLHRGFAAQRNEWNAETIISDVSGVWMGSPTYRA